MNSFFIKNFLIGGLFTAVIAQLIKGDNQKMASLIYGLPAGLILIILIFHFSKETSAAEKERSIKYVEDAVVPIMFLAAGFAFLLAYLLRKNHHPIKAIVITLGIWFVGAYCLYRFRK